ncbi:LPXTG cell wall anchor domain-containing protein [Carnobacterium maltaromaticum]|uniref:LPXTG cell wall anchor domain-containing protein n=1 Tax=Carnobacterium maltaromaticum TaxID=2751 RepID=UPI00295EB58D|nr:LPXTG cell wall anchor domain-containing protein [Carnobacterium maltaromaticum]
MKNRYLILVLITLFVGSLTSYTTYSEAKGVKSEVGIYFEATLDSNESKPEATGNITKKQKLPATGEQTESLFLSAGIIMLFTLFIVIHNRSVNIDKKKRR